MTHEPRPTDFEFAILRSELIDRFAGLEEALFKCLARFQEPPRPTSCLRERLETLAKVKASHKLSKTKKAELHRFAADNAAIVDLRNSIAHSSMTLGTRDGSHVAFFRNVADPSGELQTCLVMTREAMQSLRARVEARVAELEAYLT